MSILIFIGLLVLLILVHELGHFSVAKFFNIRVDEFGIFFPPKLASVKRGETTYSLNWLPFGGFVKIFGENADEGKNDRRSFINKPRSVQALVLVAGIVMNLLIAWLMLSLGYMAGLPTPAAHTGFGEVQGVETLIITVLPNSPAAQSGVVAEDVIAGVATGKEVLEAPITAERVQVFINEHEDESILLTATRGEEEKMFVIRPAAGFVEDQKVIGVSMDDVGVLQLPPHTALLQGGILTYRLTTATAVGLTTFFANLVQGAANFSDVAGPIGIVNLGGSAVEEGFIAALLLTAIISINLALINLLPIPGLDGGRLLIVGIESVFRRSVSPRLTLGLTALGFAFLIGLMILVSYHDITRLIG
jgi:regulator of sigma E protease